MAKIEIPASVGPVVAFVSQVVFGCAGFLLLYFAAVIASFGVHLMNEMAAQTAPWLPAIAPYIEMALFGVDLFAFGLFVVIEVIRFGKALLAGDQDI